MKIGIACFPTYGGSGVVAAELAQTLAARGHTVHLFSATPPIRLTRYVDNLVFHEVEAFSTPAFPRAYYTLDLAARVGAVTRSEGLEVLHAHYAIPHSISCILAREAASPARPKVVTTLHGTDITLVGTDPAYAPIVRFAIQASDAVTAVSEDLARLTRDAFGVERSIRAIPNFVDTERFKPAPRDTADPFTIAHVSNFRPLKRAPDVVRVFQRVAAETGAPVRLLLAGEGPDLPEVRRLVHASGLASRVCFLGRQDSVEAVLRRADLLLLPSASESFGLAALEAMAAGLPVVATDAGGIREVVVHGQTGFLEAVGDVAAMARRCLALAADPDAARAMGRAGRDRAVSLFSREAGVRRYETLYAETLAGPER